MAARSAATRVHSSTCGNRSCAARRMVAIRARAMVVTEDTEVVIALLQATAVHAAATAAAVVGMRALLAVAAGVPMVGVADTRAAVAVVVTRVVAATVAEVIANRS